MAEPQPSEFQPYLRLQGSTAKELRGILEATAKLIRRRVATLSPGVGGQVRKAQLNLVLSNVSRLLQTMWTGRINPVVAKAIEDAVEAGEDAVEALTRVAYAGLPEQAADELVRSLRATAESGFKSDAARKRRELSRRVYHQRALDDGKIEEVIRSGLVAGLSAKELAADVYRYVSPSAPGGSSYSAMRLARTEINNAFHERQLEGAKRPGVAAVKWNLSGSHRVPDKCNVYASHGGKGEWPPKEVPDKPHPQCFCYLTYVTISPEEFRDKLEDGDFDEEIKRRTRENMARLGQRVGHLTPVSEAKPTKKDPVTGDAVHDLVPKGLFRRGTLTPVQRREFKTYSTGWFIVINNSLRSGTIYTDPDYSRDLKTVQIMRTAFDESVLSEDIQVWRGMYNSKRVFGDSWNNDLTGFEWDDKGFGSTTTQEDIVDLFNLGAESGSPDIAGDTKMKVSVPAGVKAVQISSNTKGSVENGPQAEIALQDGLRWKVVKDHGFSPEGRRELEVEVIPLDSIDD